MFTYSQPHSSYQVGGSLPVNSPSYVWRKADELLFQGLMNGEFCYVFNARQMGKSSLRVKTTHRLQAQGVSCGIIDITAIGTKEVTSEQWYASILALLIKSFGLKLNLLSWWREHEHLSLINRFSDFIDTVLLTQVEQPIVIFIDEIDSVLGLKFATDDFFAFIRACYNRRAEDSKYQKLTFALFGVATPSDLIADTQRTPFNVGKAIELKGFNFSEAAPLLRGLSYVVKDPESILKRILAWTGGQPFLTQKLCKMISDENLTFVEDVDEVVNSRILDNWESQDQPEHLKTIRDRLLYSEQKMGRLLGLYQKILLRSDGENLLSGKEDTGDNNYGIIINDSPEQTELILAGLVEKKGGRLQVKNPIYQYIFDLEWVGKQLANLRPYSQAINNWITSGYIDKSWLLRGQALAEVLNWSRGKSLSDLDYRFLAASQELESQELQKTLEAKRLQAVEAKLEIERQRSLEQTQNLRLQKTMLAGVSMMMVVAIALGLFAYRQYQQTAVSEVRAIALSSEALFASDKDFDALLQAIKGKQRLQKLNYADPQLQAQVNSALQRVILSIQEYNRLNGHTAAVLAVDISPDGQQIVTGGVDKTIKIWQPNGKLIKTLTAHKSIIRVVRFSPDGKIFASAGDDKTIKLWQRDGTLIKSIPTENAGIWNIAFTPDSSTFITAGTGILEIWNREGKLLKNIQSQTIGIRDVTFSPDGETIAAACADHQIKLWNREGELKMILKGHKAPVQAIAYSPDGKLLISGGADTKIKFWHPDGKLIKTISTEHNAGIYQLEFSPDGKTFVSGSWDKTMKLWNLDGSLITTFRGHTSAIWDLAFSPDGNYLASAGAENITRLWKTKNSFHKTLYTSIGTVRKVAFHPQEEILAVTGTDQTIKLFNFQGIKLNTILTQTTDISDLDWNSSGNLLVSTGEDKTISIWKPDGNLLKTLSGHQTTILSVVWHPQNNTLASADMNGNIFLWHLEGKMIKTWKTEHDSIWSLQFSPDGKILASAGSDGTISLWNNQGKILQTLKGHDATVWKLAFSPDGNKIASGSGDMTIKIWTTSGKLLKTLTGHKAAVWGVAFSHDNQLIATGSVDETVKIWNHEGKLITNLHGHNSGIRSVAFHPYLPIVASASDDQTVVLWNLEKILNLDLMNFGCNWINDYLNTNSEIDNDNSLLCNS
ncbi:MAG: hypothetical protein EAZ87_16290 [Nostocales cyanobacterium]|nr:MAG: hypothetical protein EAZ87_16290 [Nostocales cyanobacterium]